MLEHQTVGAGALVDLVSDFYWASMDPRFSSTALSKLRDVLDGETCAIVMHDFTSGVSTLETSVGISREAIGTYPEFTGPENPWLQREESFREAGRVWLGTELASADAGALSAFYRQWLAPQGLRHQLFGVLDRQGSRVVFLHVTRTRAGAPFGDDESTLLGVLLPYLQRGMRAGQLLRRSQNVRAAAMDALDVMPVGIVLVSITGTVLGANGVARRVMADRDGLTLGRSGLEIADRGGHVSVQDLIADTVRAQDRNRAEPTLAFSIERERVERRLSILVWPARQLSRDGGRDDPAAVVFIGDPDRAGEIDEDRLRALYGLTHAESRVAALVARGYRLEEISEMLGVAYETTRKHLKQIFGKTSVARQAELARTVMTGPGGLDL